MNLKQISTIIVAVFLVLVQGISTTKNEKKLCGAPQFATGNIVGGKLTGHNEYPWLVALSHRFYENFFCGGSLISENHVITAAHCFQRKGNEEIMAPQNVIAWLGKHNLSNYDENGSKPHTVWDLILHKDYDYTNFENYEADISLVVLEVKYDLTNGAFVRIVCLPPASQDEVVRKGTVVGWGISEWSLANGTAHATTPNELEVPTVTREQCIAANENFRNLTSERTFCAGFINEAKSVCAGDSGGGVFFLDESTSSFILGGIVSVSLWLGKNEVCRSNTYTIFTDVSKFVGWINTTMKETKDIKWKDVDFQCKAGSDDALSCSHNFTGKPTRNLRIRQSHSKAPMTEKLWINFKPSTHIFSGIGSNFPKLKTLKIVEQNITHVERRNFNDLEELEELILERNKIQFLPEDIFDDLPNLKTLILNYNKINEIPAKIFSSLKQLKIVYLVENQIEYFPHDLFSQNLKFEALYSYGNSANPKDIDISKIPNVTLNYDRSRNGNTGR